MCYIFVKYVTKHFILFDTLVNGIFLNLFLDCLEINFFVCIGDMVFNNRKGNHIHACLLILGTLSVL